jgi:hypothetical protein
MGLKKAGAKYHVMYSNIRIIVLKVQASKTTFFSLFPYLSFVDTFHILHPMLRCRAWLDRTTDILTSRQLFALTESSSTRLVNQLQRMCNHNHSHHYIICPSNAGSWSQPHRTKVFKTHSRLD